MVSRNSSQTEEIEKQLMLVSEDLIAAAMSLQKLVLKIRNGSAKMDEDPGSTEDQQAST